MLPVARQSQPPLGSSLTNLSKNSDSLEESKVVPFGKIIDAVYGKRIQKYLPTSRNGDDTRYNTLPFNKLRTGQIIVNPQKKGMPFCMP